jgi:dienelactone hydrolase
VEDFRCAAHYLVTLDYVDEDRIGVFGMCAGGGYTWAAAMTERGSARAGTGTATTTVTVTASTTTASTSGSAAHGSS